MNLTHPDSDSETNPDPNHEINCFPDPAPYPDTKTSHIPDTNINPKPNLMLTL